VSVTSDLAWTGWPVALSLAAVLAGARAGEARRTEALGRALHELRRPLQALALGACPRSDGHGNGHRGANPPPPLELAICALDDLDRAVNGEPALPRRRLLSLRPVVEGCADRWGPVAGLSGCDLVLDWRAGAAAVVADPRRISQAIDNLLMNAIEHGSPPIGLSVVVRDRGVRIAVQDGGSPNSRAARRRRRGARRRRGLRVVAGVAAEHGGRFAIHRGHRGTVAVLELPLASLPVPALAGAGAA
jgi:signal transduction histidine kinase